MNDGDSDRQFVPVHNNSPTFISPMLISPTLISPTLISHTLVSPTLVLLIQFLMGLFRVHRVCLCVCVCVCVIFHTQGLLNHIAVGETPLVTREWRERIPENKGIGETSIKNRRNALGDTLMEGRNTREQKNRRNERK